MGKTTTKFELVEIEKLIPYINNARTHSPAQILKLRASLREFGFINPVIIDNNYNIIAGHGRVIAAREEGIKLVPCVYVDFLTEAQKKAYILADNRMALDAGWDEEILRNELEALEAEAFDLNLTGFDSEEISDLFDTNEAEEDEFNEADPLPENPYSQLGDIFLLGNHRLICGDSTKIETIKALVENNEIDMIFTDPPYNVDYEGGTGMKIDNDAMTPEEFKVFLSKAFANMASVTKNGAPFYVCHSDVESVNFGLALEGAGFNFTEEIVWVKNNFVFGQKDYHVRHELMMYGWKKGKAHYFVNDRTQDTVWEYNKPKKNDLHPTMKPVELVARAIKNSSKLNAKVLDIFGGSGTTLIAADQLQRTAFLAELKPVYVDVIVKRYIRYAQDYENCFLIRGDKKIPIKDIPDYQVLELENPSSNA